LIIAALALEWRSGVVAARSLRFARLSSDVGAFQQRLTAIVIDQIATGYLRNAVAVYGSYMELM